MVSASSMKLAFPWATPAVHRAAGFRVDLGAARTVACHARFDVRVLLSGRGLSAIGAISQFAAVFFPFIRRAYASSVYIARVVAIRA
jgi:hypothetical protein